MDDAQIHCLYVLCRGQTEPVRFDTVHEAITYISAENVGQGLSPVTRIVATNFVLLCFGGQDRYCGMILGERTEEDQQANMGLGEQRDE
jgi:hypothetical protein